MCFILISSTGSHTIGSPSSTECLKTEDKAETCPSGVALFFFFFFCRLEEEQLVANSKLTPTRYVTGNIDRSPARLSASSSCRLLDFIGDFLFTHLSERLNQVSEVFYP